MTLLLDILFVLRSQQIWLNGRGILCRRHDPHQGVDRKQTLWIGVTVFVTQTLVIRVGVWLPPENDTCLCSPRWVRLDISQKSSDLELSNTLLWTVATPPSNSTSPSCTQPIDHRMDREGSPPSPLSPQTIRSKLMPNIVSNKRQ